MQQQPSDPFCLYGLRVFDTFAAAREFVASVAAEYCMEHQRFPFTPREPRGQAGANARRGHGALPKAQHNELLLRRSPGGKGDRGAAGA